MKARRSVRIEKNSGDAAEAMVEHATNIRRTDRPMRPTGYPAGSIGGDVSRRNYIEYLAERYNQFRRPGFGFGPSNANFSYASIFESIERKFKMPTYFIPQSRFGELVDFLKGRINSTVSGRRGRARGISNYLSFEEFTVEQAGDGPAKKP